MTTTTTRPHFAGPRLFVRYAALEMHPLDTNDRRALLKEKMGLGMCNITKCCTEVCPENIRITDNAIIPLKERVADEFYDPLEVGVAEAHRERLEAEVSPWPEAAPARAAWTWVAPILAWVALIIALVTHLGGAFLVVVALLLGAAVFAAVHHAEVVAHRVGEPFGTLVLAVAVTVIEVALIVSVMLSGGEAKAALARDTVFSAIMICCNGILGLCLLLGGIRHREQAFQIEGASVALAVLGALAILSLVLPNFTTSAPGSRLVATPARLRRCRRAGALRILRLRPDRAAPGLLPPGGGGRKRGGPRRSATNRQALISLGLLLVSLVAVVGLAKVLSPSIEAAVANAGAPAAVVGIIIAALVLLPEGMAATKAAGSNRLQTSLNLALGSALASIGLTIPVLAGIFIVSRRPLVLGLEPKETVLLVLTLFLGTITLGTGKSNLIKGVVHLVVFAAFLFLSVVP